MGWRVLVVHECELKDKAALSARLAEALRPETERRRKSAISGQICLSFSLAPKSAAVQHRSLFSSTDAPNGTTARIQSLPLRSADASEKDVPLRDDIRLLGRILGDTVREQEGEEVFELVEQIRQASIRFHRDNEIGARRELEATLDSLNADQTLAIVARLQLFLASRQHRRRSASHPPQPRPCDRRLRAPPGFARLRFQRTREMGVEPSSARRFLRSRAGKPGADRPSDRSEAQEHATGNSRSRNCSTSANALAGDADELALNEERLRRAVLILWRTNMLRQTQLKVIDEVANALSFYDYTFFHELPRLYGAIEDRARRHFRRAAHEADSARSYASGRGSAATATAIRSSPLTCSTSRCGCRAPGRSAIIWTNCTSSAPSCRSPPISPR